MARTKEDLRRVVDFGHVVYRQNPHWVPPDAARQVVLLSGEAANGEHTRVQTYWVEDHRGDVMAAVTAAVDDAFNRYWRKRIGHLFFFEALRDKDGPVRSLLDAACDWLREQGCDSARLSFHYGWQLPLTIDAYDEVPTFLHTYNPSYYHRSIKNAGFVTERGFVEYRIRFTPELSGDYQRMVARAVQSGVGLRSWDPEGLREEAARFHAIYNETYGKHWGAPQFTLPEIEELVEELKDFSLAELSQFAELEGQPVGAVLAFPELNRAFHAMRGKDIGENFDEFQRHVRDIDHGILLSISVKEGGRGRGIALAMAARTYLAMMERGYRSTSYTIVIDDNWPSRRTAERLGGTVARNYATYRRELD